MLEYRCSVIGLGKLGAPLAAVLASKGLQTIGVDLNKEFVDKINSGNPPVYEPQLEQYLLQAKPNLQATTDYRTAILESNVTFVIVPTPSDEQGMFSNKYIIEAMAQIGSILAEKNEYHVINVTSTVMPGTTESIVRNTLESSSGKEVGKDIGLCYNPEFIALGQVIQDMLKPDFILIGEFDSKSGNALESIYRKVCENNPNFQRMNLVNAEIAKISVNTFVTTKITYANMLSDLCDRLPGADVDIVTDAVGLDSRIGSKYLQGRLGYAGPCFPRDNIAFAKLAEQLGARYDLAAATDNMNFYQIERLYKKIQQKSDAYGFNNVAILGLSYKPNSVVMDASQGVALAEKLVNSGFAVNVYDPVIPIEQLSSALPAKIEIKDSMLDCICNMSILVITTAYEEFSELTFTKNQRIVIFDCWRQLDPKAYAPPVEVVQLGVCLNSTESPLHGKETKGGCS